MRGVRRSLSASRVSTGLSAFLSAIPVLDRGVETVSINIRCLLRYGTYIAGRLARTDCRGKGETIGIGIAILAIVLLAAIGGSTVDVPTRHQGRAAAADNAARHPSRAEQPVAESIGERTTTPERLAMQNTALAPEEFAAATAAHTGNPCVKADGTMYQDCAYFGRRPGGYRAPETRLANDWVHFAAR